MIEIIVLITLTSNIGKIVRAKGLKAAGYQWATVGMWFGFEIIGAFIGAILAALLFSGSDGGQCVVYIIALGSAALGGWLGYRRAQNAEPAPGTISTPAVVPLAAAGYIQELQKQLDEGLISIQQFEEKKAEILAMFR